MEVLNKSDEAATVEIVREDALGAAVLVTSTDVVPPGARRDVNLKRPDLWAIHVNGTAVTRAAEWPSDNPTIDLDILIHEDGSVEVIDN